MNYHIPRKGYGFRDLLRRGLDGGSLPSRWQP
jgi:hypothetical protein